MGRVDNDHVIAAIEMTDKIWFSFPHKCMGNLRRNATQHLTFDIKYMPRADDIFGLGRLELWFS